MFGTGLLCLVAAAALVGDQAPAKDVVAIVGTGVITDAMIDAEAGEALARLKADEYRVRKQALDNYIGRLLMEDEARLRGISVRELRTQEIERKVLPVTEDAKRAIFESSPQYQGRPEAEALVHIGSRLRQMREAAAQRKLTESLKGKTSVKIFLSPPRIEMDLTGEPANGPAGAVTVVTFGDYQCPFSGQIEPTIKEIQRKYAGRVRVVFRDFPLAQIHPHAIKAAEGAECARDQGRFWEMHDRLFSDQQALATEGLVASAAGLGLDTSMFLECLTSGRKEVEWLKDQKDGIRSGVTGTPAIFVNGRVLRAAATVESLSELIDEELGWPPDPR